MCDGEIHFPANRQWMMNDWLHKCIYAYANELALVLAFIKYIREHTIYAIILIIIISIIITAFKYRNGSWRQQRPNDLLCLFYSHLCELVERLEKSLGSLMLYSSKSEVLIVYENLLAEVRANKIERMNVYMNKFVRVACSSAREQLKIRLRATFSLPPIKPKYAESVNRSKMNPFLYSKRYMFENVMMCSIITLVNWPAFRSDALFYCFGLLAQLVHTAYMYMCMYSYQIVFISFLFHIWYTQK